MREIFCAVLVACLIMSGCSPEGPKQVQARLDDKGQKQMDWAGEACKNGVVYYVTYFDRGVGIAPAFNPDSTVRTCE